jgi:adenylate kinase
MSASPSRALHTIAADLLALLGPYEADVALLLRRWPDDAQFQRVWRHVEQIRLYSGAVQEVRVQATSVMIAHAELIQLLCRSQAAYEVGMGRDIADARARHHECVAALRFRLQWVMNRAAAAVS